MSNQSVTFTINLGGNAYKGVLQLDNAVEQVIGSVKNATSVFDKLGRNALNFDVITNAVSKVSQAFQSVVGTSLDFEQQQANLKTLLNGDTEATERLVSQIREYGKASVYSRGGLIEAQKTMMSFGLDAEYAFGKLKNIGDIALGDSQKMNSLALAFSQMSSTGKLMGQDLLQMINAGFNPLEVISQKTGKSMATLKEEMSKGAISADLVAQAFEWATEEGGRFYQGAETAAQTTAGKIAKMNDTIDDMKVKLFEATGGATAWIAEMSNMIVPISQMYPLAASVFKGIRSGIGWCITGMKNFALATKAAGGFFPWLKGIATIACKGISVAIGSIPIVGWIAIAVTAVTAFTAWLYTKFESVRNWLDGIGSIIAGPLVNVVTSFIKHWNSVKTAFTDGGILAGIKRIGFVIIDAMLKPVQALLELLSKVPGLGKLAEKGSKWIGEMRDNLDKATYVTPKAKAEDSTSVLSPGKPGASSGTGSGKLTKGNLGSTAGTVAGKAQQINITLGNMVGTMNFNGGLADNKDNVERYLMEMMARVLGMAETAA
jgi:tape measure domain-containing protein